MKSVGFVSALVLVAACGNDPGKAPDATTDDFDRSAMLAHLAENVLLPIQATFATRAAALPAAIAAHCDALDAGQPGATLETARTATGAAIDAWEHAEAVIVGPAAMDHEKLRFEIYAWPLLGPCELDRDVTSRWANPASYDVSTKLVNARSLTAVEYLLYPTTTAHSCVSAPAGWDALGADLPRARCRLALAIATDVAAKGAELHTAWRADGGNYIAELANAGTTASSIKSAQEGVNRISDGMFYVDKMVKDMKLGETAGIAVNSCQTVQTPCVREVELRFSDRATFALRANLAALREAFTGKTPTKDGPGFDDMMIALGQPELATRMTASLDAAIAATAALPDSFLTALDTDYAKVVATHAAVRAFTDDFKSQFLTVLDLEIPDDVATDND
jgi:predicted lipoprotein